MLCPEGLPPPQKSFPKETAQLKILIALSSVTLNVTFILTAWRFCLMSFQGRVVSDSLKYKVLSLPVSEEMASFPPVEMRRKGASDLYVCNLIKGLIWNGMWQNFQLAQCTAATFLASGRAREPQIDGMNPPVTSSPIQSCISLWFWFFKSLFSYVKKKKIKLQSINTH